ncbi:STM4015 family protein [Verrucomicrobiota bacterium sgz303538]
MISDHATEWLGYPVELYDPEDGAPDYKNKIYRLALDWDSEATLVDLFAQFIEYPASSEAPGIIFGLFGEHDSSSAPIVEALVAARDRLPNLKGIFLGDILSEENEISWIIQSDVSSLFLAYPTLEHFRVRGNNELSLGRIKHDKLKSLVVETGGLSASVVRDVLASQLPALEHLELWLGSDNYGWDGTIDDLKPLIQGSLFPNLKYLGLRDSEISDDIAKEIASSPILQRIEVLDLSLGTLGDAGAQALLASPAIKSLKKLDLHHNYLSDEVRAKFQSLGIEVNTDSDGAYGDGDDRYVAVSE